MKVTLNNIEYTLEYKETHIGDKVYDLGQERIYEASIADADDINWIVVFEKCIMKNIHILPTDKPSRLFINPLWEHQLRFVKDKLIEKNKERLPQNIYITSDEEIKEGDCTISLNTNRIFKTNKEDIITIKQFPHLYKKIILSTADLINDGVQPIDDEFLDWFVKNPSCESIEVKKEKIVLGEVSGTIYTDFKYKIIIPKEEPKPETLEEAAKKYDGKNAASGVKSFIEGAKWEQERSYSEQEVFNLLMEFSSRDIHSSSGTPHSIAKWFEQFKKK